MRIQRPEITLGGQVFNFDISYSGLFRLSRMSGFFSFSGLSGLSGTKDLMEFLNVETRMSRKVL